MKTPRVTIKEQWDLSQYPAQSRATSDYEGHFRVAGRVVRVTLQWDHAYNFQSRALVEERSPEGAWSRMGSLLPGNRAMEGQPAGPGRRAAMERDRDTLLELAAAVLA